MTFLFLVNAYFLLLGFLGAFLRFVSISSLLKLKLLRASLLCGLFLIALLYFFSPLNEWIFDGYIRYYKNFDFLSLPGPMLPMREPSPKESFLALPDFVGSISVVWILCGLFYFIWKKFYSNKQVLKRCKKDSLRFKKIGNVELYYSSQIQGASTLRHLKKVYIFLNLSQLKNRCDLKMVMRHEFFHHRNGDFLWSAIMDLSRGFMFWNPFFYIFSSQLSLLEEESCDEAVLGNGSESSQDYLSLLFRMAQFRRAPIHSLEKRASLRAILGFSPKSQLRRRVMNIIKQKQIASSNFRKGSLIALVALFSGTFALTLSAAPTLWTVTKLNQYLNNKGTKNVSEGFPLTVNERVVKKLNSFVQVPAKRKWFKDSVQRMNSYSHVVDPLVEKFGVPQELKILALVESGYQNLKPNKNTAAGVWQFIEPTAKLFGLIKNGRDDRFDVKKQTEAAMRYLLSEKLVFDDWELAIMAYNAGASKVRKGIRKTGSRNAWELIRQGYEGDRGYLEKYMAALILSKNPKLLDL